MKQFFIYVIVVAVCCSGCISTQSRFNYSRSNSPTVTADHEIYDYYYSPNPALNPEHSPVSTLSLDVDTASYANIRRYLQDGQSPPAAAVRVEEMVNYFHYQDPVVGPQERISASMELGPCPWNGRLRLLRVAVRAAEVNEDAIPPRYFTLAVDTSGSMNDDNKLALVKHNLHLFVDQLQSRDSVAIITYAYRSKQVLDRTRVGSKAKIHHAIDRLRAKGKTAGSAGLKLAYEVADQDFHANGLNRILIFTDGDFNVGETQNQELVELVQAQRDRGIYLTVVGYGTGNLNDSMLQAIAANGQGQYLYMDSREEAERQFGKFLHTTMMTVAEDVKVQVEFNPTFVKSYRMIGYENRVMAPEGFNDDSEDAVELGSGQTVIVLYALELENAFWHRHGVDPLKYGGPQEEKDSVTESDSPQELATVKVRYKIPGQEHSQKQSHVLWRQDETLTEFSADFQWSAAVAGFGLLLRGDYGLDLDFKDVLRWAKNEPKSLLSGSAKEFRELVKSAQRLAR